MYFSLNAESPRARSECVGVLGWVTFIEPKLVEIVVGGNGLIRSLRLSGVIRTRTCDCERRGACGGGFGLTSAIALHKPQESSAHAGARGGKQERIAEKLTAAQVERLRCNLSGRGEIT